MKDLVKEFEETRKKLDFLESEISSRAKEIFMPKILEAKSSLELEAIKVEVGKTMPNCASMILMFRSIIIKEQELINKNYEIKQ